jgi:hypothetical protein
MFNEKEIRMSQESKKIVGFIKNLAITNSAYVAVLNRLKTMTADKQERFLSKFHGMELSDFMMAVEG